MITNTHSVGVVRDAAIAWRVQQGDADASGYWWSTPVVAETWDGVLNDINGFHVKRRTSSRRSTGAKGGPVAEGNVGGGTGMICHGFKGGIGTASRASTQGPARTPSACWCRPTTACAKRCDRRRAGRPAPAQNAADGHETAAEATTARSSSWSRPTRRCCRTSSSASRGARPGARAHRQLRRQRLRRHLRRLLDRQREGLAAKRHAAEFLDNDRMDPLFAATVQATEEAIVNALVAARDMTGINGRHRCSPAARRADRPDEALRPGRQHAEVEPVPVEVALKPVPSEARSDRSRGPRRGRPRARSAPRAPAAPGRAAWSGRGHVVVGAPHRNRVGVRIRSA